MRAVACEGGKMEPVRTCVGCRRRAPRSSLVRVVARDGVVTVDAAARLDGRGAWVHPARQCVTTAVSRNAFGRALRVAGRIDAGPLHERDFMSDAPHPASETPPDTASDRENRLNG